MEQQLDLDLNAELMLAASTPQPAPPPSIAPGARVNYRAAPGTVAAILGKTCVVELDSGEKINTDWGAALQAGELIYEANCAEETSAQLASVDSGDVTGVRDFNLTHVECEKYRTWLGEIAPQIARIQVEQPCRRITSPLREDLHPTIVKALNRMGISALYSHQVEAIECIRGGSDLVLATPTASGKTLSFNPGIIEYCLNVPTASAIYLYPLKALANDQVSKLRSLLKGTPVRCEVLTGDVDPQKRLHLFCPSYPQILCMSPDLLHHQLYKTKKADEWQQWRLFLQNLRFVVVDEAHTMTGNFGSHFCNLMRRLRLAVAHVGGDMANIQYVFSTASVGNPLEMAARFTDRPPESLALIDKSGAGSIGRTIAVLRPTDRVNVAATEIAISWLKSGITGIIFTNSRDNAKYLTHLIVKNLELQGMHSLMPRIVNYYGSMRSDRRLDAIAGLQDGRYRLIISTSALESGIDLPSLDAVLIKGFPGSIMSWKQRIGRAGRKNPGLVIFLPDKSQPLDYYYGNHPEALIEGDSESVICNSDYPTLLAKHIQCASAECGIPHHQLEDWFGTSAPRIAGVLLERQKLFMGAGRLFAKGYPHYSVNLRGSANNNVKAIALNPRREIEEISFDLAISEVHAGAIYSAPNAHGEMVKYRVTQFLFDEKTALLTLEEPDSRLFTTSDALFQVEPRSHLASSKVISTDRSAARLRLSLRWGSVGKQVVGYRLMTRSFLQICQTPGCQHFEQQVGQAYCPSCRRNTKPREISDCIGEYELSSEYRSCYQTPILKLEINKPLREAIEEYVLSLQQEMSVKYGEREMPPQLKVLWDAKPEMLALHSIIHCLQLALPTLVLCSCLDLSSYCEALKDTEEMVGTVAYAYDTTEGGNGATEALFHRFTQVSSKAREMICGCDCEFGCPRCLVIHGCPQGNKSLHKGVAVFLLNSITGEQA